jgi:transcriptional regulator with XRE-family HTH domain
MEVNAVKIKALRTKHGWTQQHLADACAISLRTVQRVERYGNASQETVASLAAVFEVLHTELVVVDQPVELISNEGTASVSPQSQAIILAALAGACLGALIMYVIGLSI